MEQLERLLALKMPVIAVLDQDPKKDVRQLTLKKPVGASEGDQQDPGSAGESNRRPWQR